MKRIAGFGADALVDQLEETRRAGDDIACVVFRGLVFKAGSTTFTPRALQELDTVARALLTVPEKRVEIGSRLGPGRPMASDARLRLDRARLVRERLISRGVAPGRLLIDEGEGYERVADDLTRAGGTRVQSMGLCVHHA
jgi:outer membrane protein OmpA-like peptidoglycan-associated protein